MSSCGPKPVLYNPMHPFANYGCDLSGEGVSDEKVIVTEYYTILHTD